MLIVLDGATTRTKTGCHHGAAWYARMLGAQLVAAAVNPLVSLAQALTTAIANVADLHPECDVTHPGTPSAGLAVLRREEEGDLTYLVLGDVTIVADLGGELVVITDDRVSQTAKQERANADKHVIGSAAKAAALVEMKHSELAARNTPGGYWIAAADPTVVEQALRGVIEKKSLRRLAVLSDRAARSVVLCGHHTWRSLLETLASTGPQALIDEVRAAEDEDPVGATFPRNKKSDDASVVYVKLD